MDYNPYAGSTGTAVSPFAHKTYTVNKQMLKLFGGSFRIYDPMGSLVLFASMKAFKLKEDITLYTREDKLEAVLTIKARSIVDFSATYDVIDPATSQAVGALKRKGVKSLFRDEWIIMDPFGNQIGLISEDSIILALLRRWVTGLIPQTYHGQVRGRPVLTFKQNFNPFTFRLSVDFTPDITNELDRRLGIAAAVLFCAIEQRQN